jgi:hypothetical protein
MSFLDGMNTAGGYDPDNWEAHLDDVIDVDLSDASERRQYENVVLPAGTYRMRIEGGQNKTTDSGHKYISLWMTPVEGEYANKTRVFDSFWMWGDYAPNHKARWKEVRRVTGNDETIAGTLRDVVNHEVRCKVIVRESKRKGYEGEMENSIRAYMSIRGVKAQTASAAKTFAAAPTPPTASQPAAAAAPQAAPVTPSIIAQNQQAVQAVQAPATPQQGTAMPTYNTQQGQQQQAQAQQPVQQPMNQNIQPSEQQQTSITPF